MSRVTSFIILSFMSVILYGQKNILLFSVKPILNNELLELNRDYLLNNTSDSLKIETLKFYISNVKFLLKGKPVFEEKSKFRLLDWENNESFKFDIKYPKVKFDKISFCIGLDSLTNVSGALAGDLDPTNGMYWTWQSGYINFKLEGYSNKSKGRNGKFQYHLGGYQDPFNCLQELTYPLIDQSELQLELAIDKFLSFVNLELDSEIMSPGKKAILLSEKFKEIFTIRK